MKRVILRVMMLVAMASAAVTMSVHTSSKEVKASEKGDAVVKYAKNFVGNRYRYGGSSLTKGTDCSVIQKLSTCYSAKRSHFS